MPSALARVSFSLLMGGVFYSLWLAVFLRSGGAGESNAMILWFLAPVVTALGFALGIVLFERHGGSSTTGFLGLFLWPLIGCAVGALVVFWFGPMLIVFGMLAGGTVSVALREAMPILKRGQGQEL